MTWRRWWRNTRENLMPARRVAFVESDSLPETLPRRGVIVAREEGELWSAGMMCPCGCGDLLELALLEEARPRWSVGVDRCGRASLSPSVWRKTGCGSHFWLRRGRVRWCD